ncbi:MAG: hypothetical protein LWW86_05375 [Micrococcales bacterium]|nr:hypothetical protein [Micrococcales bacterium]
MRGLRRRVVPLADRGATAVTHARLAAPRHTKAWWAGYAVTAAALAGVLVALPADECGASISGACITSSDDPFPTRVALGDPARLRLGTITPVRVMAARTFTVTAPGATQPVGTDYTAPKGSFILAVVHQGMSTDEPRSGQPWLTSDGVTLLPRSGFGGISQVFDAGVREESREIFVVPDGVNTDDLTLWSSFGSAQDAARTPLGRQQVQDRLVVGMR